MWNLAKASVTSRTLDRWFSLTSRSMKVLSLVLNEETYCHHHHHQKINSDDDNSDNNSLLFNSAYSHMVKETKGKKEIFFIW
jgi:hypothetical protein